MTDEILMTQEGYDNMKKELEYLKNEKMPIIIERIDTARQLGDLSENAEYHEAKDDQGLAAAKIREYTAKLELAKIVEKTAGDVIDIGSQITIEDESGKEREMEIVDQTQADPANGNISNESPLGADFIGNKVGDEVSIVLPAGVKKYKIVKVS